MDRALQAAILCGLVVLLGLVSVALLAPGIAAVEQIESEDLDPNKSVPIATPGFDSAERLILTGGNPTIDEAAPTVDPAMATTGEFRELTHAWEMYQFEAAVDEEGTSEGQVVVIEAELEQLQNEVAQLNHDEQTAYRNFETGQIGATTFLAETASIQQRAGLLYARLETIRDASRGVTAPAVADNVTSIQANVGWLQLETETFEGPIRTDAWSTFSGGTGYDRPITVYATESGYAISTTDDVMYTRELYKDTNHDRDAGGFLSTDAGGERTAELYPWTYTEAFEQDPTARGDLFREILTHPHGTTTTVLNGGTELPFREIHELDLAAVPTAQADSDSAGNVTATLEYTYAGGPALIEVTEEDGDPVTDATVTVDPGIEYEPDGEGTVWVTTTDDSIRVTIVAAGERLELEADLPIGEPAS